MFPFLDPSRLPRHVVGNLKHILIAPVQRSYFGWLVLFAVVVVFLAWRRRRSGDGRSLLARAFPRSIYLHRSALLDYRFFVVDKVIEFALIGFIFMTSFRLARWAADGIGADGTAAPSWWAILFFGSATVVAYDFGYTYAHILGHRVPFLWQFHKVHHAAEVMTPITNFREHPVDRAFHAIAGSVPAAAVDVVYLSIYQGEPYYSVFGINAILIAYYVFVSFRHSHVWIDYGPRLSWWFSSPAQHQIHHSRDPEHFNKNYSQIFSFWDAFFGSLYIPTREDREKTIEFGIPEDTSGLQTVRGLYVTPFKDAAELVRAGDG